MTDPTVRRSAVVEIAGRKYQVREPNPSKAYRVTDWCAKMLGPVFAQILSGQLIDMEPAKCPKCEATDQAKNVGSRQWLCMAPQPDDPMQVCGRLWDQKPRLDPQGKPARVTLEYALNSERWRALLGVEVGKALGNLDVDDSEAFMHEVLVGSMDIEAFGKWIPVQSVDELDQHVPNGATIRQLMKAAMGAWVLPSLADGLGTLPASSAEKTPGGSEPATPPRPLRTAGPPPTQASR